jgi:translation initiation factor 2 subunit 1
MLYKKEGLPEEDELVLCTVTNVQHHSVFAKLDEYDKSGMIHISEISPGRIRNIRDYVVEGKKLVCKVLRIDKQKGHIDLSLRRVNESQRRNKLDQIKQETRAEKIIEGYCKQNKLEFKSFYEKVSSIVFSKYEYIHECFNDLVEGKADLEKLGLEKKYTKGLVEIIKEKIKPAVIEITGELKLISYNEEGIDDIKSALKKAGSSDSVRVLYLGAGRYKIVVTSSNYKDAEKIIKNSADKAIRFIEKKGGSGEFLRKEK